MKAPKPLEVDAEELSVLKERVAASNLEKGDSELLQRLIAAYLYVVKLLEAKNTTIKRLRRLFFGSKSEKASKILDPPEEKEAGSDKDPPDDGGGGGAPPEKKPKKRKGHGRNGAAAYTGADRVSVPHETLKHGDPCPECPKGKVYVQEDPGVIVRIRGAAPLMATVYELEKLRCNLCGAFFTARAPEEAGKSKYDETSRAMIALLKYGAGVPFNRLEKLQASLGIPMPSSTQWDQVEKGANAIYPAFEELVRQAAQGETVYNDDTVNRILTLMEENKTKAEGERTGIFTTGIISTLGERIIAIFHTGRRHAGENLDALLEKRDADRGVPTQMADAASRNVPKSSDTLLASCLTHGRRHFVDIADAFPEECRHVIEIIGKVYKNDAITKAGNMTPEERLTYHQLNSGPLMSGLESWMSERFDKKLTEPNSSLGKAIKYLQNHWDELTLFLRVPGAPLDSNIVERALKIVILHRKNALFYRTLFGAYIGDMYLSIIYTCSLMKANPFDYLVALQRHSSAVFREPSRWMPWNFKETLASIGA